MVGTDDGLRTPVEYQRVEVQRMNEEGQIPEPQPEVEPEPEVKPEPEPGQAQGDYRQWIEAQHEEHQQHVVASSSSGLVSAGGRRSPRTREASPQDPELSSLSALSQFSTGLSVSSNLRLQTFLSSVADRVQVDSDADSAMGDLASP